MGRNLVLMTAAAGLAGLLAFGTAAAQGDGSSPARKGGMHRMHDGGDGPGGMMGMGMGMGSLRGLNLSEEQRSQIRTIMSSRREQNMARRQQMAELRQQLEDTVVAGGFDEARVRALISARSDLLTESMVDMVRTMAEVRAVLTPEQQQQYDARRAEMRAKRAERQQRQGPRSN